MSISTPGMNPLQSEILQSMKAHWGLLLFEGIVLVALGLFAIVIPVVATLAMTIVLGWVFLISGFVGLFTTFAARHAPGFWWSLLSAVLAIVAGFLLLVWPVSGAVSVTMLLIAFFTLEGVASIMYAIEHKRELSGKWGWMLVSGIVDLALAGIIFAGFPITAAWALGLLVGIDMVFGGTALMSIAIGARTAGS